MNRLGAVLVFSLLLVWTFSVNISRSSEVEDMRELIRANTEMLIAAEASLSERDAYLTRWLTRDGHAYMGHLFDHHGYKRPAVWPPVPMSEWEKPHVR